jgi:hypothetical protein
VFRIFLRLFLCVMFLVELNSRADKFF